MTPKQFTAAVAQVGWTLRGVADHLQLPPIRITRWATGEKPVPDEVAQWLKTLAITHKQNPPPKLNDVRTYVKREME
jgi:hypothetical protein